MCRPACALICVNWASGTPQAASRTPDFRSCTIVVAFWYISK